jgi:hypothetical protein
MSAAFDGKIELLNAAFCRSFICFASAVLPAPHFPPVTPFQQMMLPQAFDQRS